MGLRDIFSSASEHVMETYDEDGKTRPPELAVVERDLHKGFDSWTKDHKIRYPKMGRLPYRPDLFPDQRIDRPHRPISQPARLLATGRRSENLAAKGLKPAIYLGELAYLGFLKKAHAKTVGSKALSETMILGFLETPAFGDSSDSPSIAEYVAETLESEEDRTIGLTSAHLGALADIGEIAGALSIGVAELYGFKYIDRFNTLINSNMTRQTYRVGSIPVPIPWLMRSGTGIYWGVPPGESAERHGIQEHALSKANAQFLTAFHEHNQRYNQVLAYVPAGSGAVPTYSSETGELKDLLLKDPTYTSTLTRWCGGGNIPVNKYGENVAIGSVIKNEKPVGISRKEYSKILADQVTEEHARQAHELTGVPIKFVKLHPEKHTALIP